MIVKVRFIALAADLTGRTEYIIDIDKPIPLSKLVNDIYDLFPRLKQFSNLLVILVNGEKHEPTYVVKEGDEVAFVPPSSGGV